MATEKIIIDLSVEGITKGKQSLEEVRSSISDIRKEIEKLAGKNDTWSTSQLDKYNKSLEKTIAEEKSLAKEISTVEKQLTSATNATTALTTAQQRAATQATNTGTAINSSFSVVGQTLQTMGAITDTAFSKFANATFPRFGEMSRNEVKIVQQSYQQATSIIESNGGEAINAAQMQVLANKALKGNIEDVTTAMINFQRVLSNNVGADAVITTTTALLALKNQAISGGYEVNVLNKNINQMGVSGGQSFSSMLSFLNKFQAELIDVDLDGILQLESELQGLQLEFSDASIKYRSFAGVVSDESTAAGAKVDKLGDLVEGLKEKISKSTQVKAVNDIVLSYENAAQKVEDFNKAIMQTGETTPQLKSFSTTLVGMRQIVSSLEDELSLMDNTIRSKKGERYDEVTAQLKKLRPELAALEAGTRNASMKGFDPLSNSITQMARELPNFAINAQIGFMAISNNLPIMLDEINKVRAANEVLKSQGKETTSVLKQVGASLIGFNTLIAIGTMLLTKYGPVIWEWTKALFEGEKQIDKTRLALRTLIDSTKDYSNAGKTTVESVIKMGKEIEKFGGNIEYTAILVDEYNALFNTQFKTIDEITKAYPKMATAAIDAAIKQAAALKLITKASEVVLKEQSASFVLSEYSDSQIKNTEKAFNRIAEAQRKMLIKQGKSEAEIIVERNKLFTKITSGVAFESTLGGIGNSPIEQLRVGLKNDFMLSKSLSEDFNAISSDVGQRITKAINIKKSTKIEIENLNKAINELLQAPVIKLEKDKDTISSTGSKKIDVKDVANRDPDIAALDEKLVIYGDYIKEKRKLTNEEQVELDFALVSAFGKESMFLKTKKDGYMTDLFNRNQYDFAMRKARLQDSLDLKESVEYELFMKKKKFEQLELLAQLEIIKININKQKNVELVNKLNGEILDAEQALIDDKFNLKAEEDKLTDKLSKKAYEDQVKVIEEGKRKVNAAETKVTGLKATRTNAQKAVDDAKIESKKISDQLASDSKKTIDEVEVLNNKLIELGTTITKNQNIVNTSKMDKFITDLNDAKKAADQLGNSVGNISSTFGSLMQAEDNKTASLKNNLELSDSYRNADTESQQEQMYQLEKANYENKKAMFETKKKFDIGQTIINGISGVIGAIAGAAPLGPWGWALGAIEAASITAATIASVAEISSQTLDAPIPPKGKSSSSSGGVGGGSMNGNALNPNKSAMTTSQENLNMMNKSNNSSQGETIVKVSDINKVQKTVTTRENNSSY